MNIKKHPASLLFSMIAGVLMMGYVTVEALILKQVPPGPTPIEIFYFVLGLAVLLLSGFLRKKITG